MDGRTQSFDTVKDKWVIIYYNCSEFIEEIKNEKNVLNAVKNTAKYIFKNI